MARRRIGVARLVAAPGERRDREASSVKGVDVDVANPDRPDALDPVFRRVSATSFVPTPLAAGPLGGIQGGAVAGLMATVIEDAAPDGMKPLSIRVDFLRPAPLAELRIDVDVVRIGRRVATMSGTALVGQVSVARAVMTYARPGSSDLVTPTEPVTTLPTSSTPTLARPIRGEPYFMDVFDSRIGTDGTYWFRWLASLCEGASGFSHVLGPADWAHGVTRPRGVDGSGAGFPTVDLAIALHRPPIAPWIGLQVASTWTERALGTGGGTLCDAQGVFGRMTVSFVVTPTAKAPHA